MLISNNWLRELTDTILSPQELRESLTMVGLAIDAVEDKEDDQILDVEVPSNRPDCLSHIGIAREVSVIESGKVTLPAAMPPKTSGRTADDSSVEILAGDLCPRYAARLVRGVKIGPSPEWLVNRLEVIGQRPINNVADITNYVLHETGQPLHAFDLAKLEERRIVVRTARAGEKLKTLDGVERKLTPDMLVIADAARPVALAGIMGGEDSEISNQTTDVLIESAYFNPDSVRRTARALGMDTEASRRFERGADFGGILRAQARCVELICDIAGGVAAEDALDVVEQPQATRSVIFHYARVQALTSLTVAESEMLRILQGLGFELTQKTEQSATFIVPSWRVDVEREEDLVEEIARHTGYHFIGSELPPGQSAGEYQHHELKRRALRRSFASAGFDEAINFSFIDNASNELFETVPEFAGSQSDGGAVTLRNPILEDAVTMRQSLLPGLLSSLRNNLNHGQRDVRLIEVGRIFAMQGGKQLPLELESLGFVVSGGAVEEGRAQAPREADFSDLKGALESAIDAMKLGPLTFEAGSQKHLRPGQTAIIKIKNMMIGSMGRLAESTASSYKFRQPVYVGELDLTSLLASVEKPIRYQALARYPSVSRDVTLLVKREVAFNDLIQAINAQDLQDCRNTQLVGTYEGANIPEDKRAVTLRVEYRSDERTLRDDEVEEMHQQIVGILAKKFDAELH
ncbi:MAG TPA: phenylalanine--tRNA ligase subunit beta [Pyrinomonadaceae bacterium]|nr:phenylalanine--tRNA ligase subunit beta [Pyrinomonadaceae bacterium]